MNNICEFPIEIKNKNKDKTALTHAIERAFKKAYGTDSYDVHQKNIYLRQGEIFRSCYPEDMVRGAEKKGNTDYFVVAAGGSPCELSARLVFVTTDNISNVLDACQKDVKKKLKANGLAISCDSDKVRLYLTENNDMKPSDVRINASYSKQENFERKDKVYFVASLIIILCSIGVAVEFNEYADVRSNAIAVAVTLVVSSLLSFFMKLFDTKKIKIDDFQQWTEPFDRGLTDYVETDDLENPTEG